MIGCIGDLHFKDHLSYGDRIADRRDGERVKVLDYIVETLKDCKHVVFLGDNFNSKNNSAETNREFVKFVERFVDKDVYIISGNHEKRGDGTTAIDFLGEIKNRPNWHIFTRPGTVSIPWGRGKTLKLDFLPYMLNSELEVEDYEEASKKILRGLDGGDILFGHHVVSGMVVNGLPTDMMKEVVLPKEKLEKKYQLVVVGHIHDPGYEDKIVQTGSVFTAEVGEREKFIHIIDKDLKVQRFPLPVRPIIKVESPKIEDLLKIPPGSIVKVVLTEKPYPGYPEEVKGNLDRFDASLLIEDYPNSRKKAHIQDGAFDFSIEALLKLYAKEKNVDADRLLKGLQLIA